MICSCVFNLELEAYFEVIRRPFIPDLFYKFLQVIMDYLYRVTQPVGGFSNIGNQDPVVRFDNLFLTRRVPAGTYPLLQISRRQLP